ncbi:hypothetical protein WME95_05295 [Sorangium sp. So ce327]|uniref:hypothetical protein n=1 Tax=Sorangium sp. So ce327 TaxID=3133301 RepID=UPI003F5E0740
MRKSLLGALALLVVGCSGPDVSRFEGTWRAVGGRGTSSCYGDWELRSSFNIRLREGEDSDLEYITLDEEGQPWGSCIYGYSVEGEVATLDGQQTCVRTGFPEYIEMRWIYTRDDINLVDHWMREDGEAVVETDLFDGTTETCNETYTYEFVRP